MSKKNNIYRASTFSELLKIPDNAGMIIYDTYSEECSENKETFQYVSKQEVDQLLLHPLSIIINPCSKTSMDKYQQLVVILSENSDIKLPLHGQLINKQRIKLDRYQWSYKWYMGNYEQFLDLALSFTAELNSL